MLDGVKFLALGTTVVLWAAAFPAIRVGVDGLGVAGLSVLRLGIAAVALAIVAPLFKVRLPRRRDLLQIALCGASGMTAYQLLLNLGEVRVAAGTASLLISMAPVFSVLLAGSRSPATRCGAGRCSSCRSSRSLSTGPPGDPRRSGQRFSSAWRRPRWGS
jgi:drug/metabolite transporter (DMT)-like permease